MDLQELISRGRFLMADAPGRLRVYELATGKRSAKEIAVLAKREPSNTLNDLKLLADAGLLQKRIVNGKILKKDGYLVYEKVPLAKTVPLRYFSQATRVPVGPLRQSRGRGAGSKRKTRGRGPAPLSVPSEQDILDIARHGEDQPYEFKGQGTDVQKIAREIAAMANTEQGGIVFYGIADDGTIQGSDLKQQKLDQPLQNVVRTSIDPPAAIHLYTVEVTGSPIICIMVPPWNRRDVYQYNEKILLRKGSNVFAAKPTEVRRLHNGEVVI